MVGAEEAVDARAALPLLPERGPYSFSKPTALHRLSLPREATAYPPTNARHRRQPLQSPVESVFTRAETVFHKAGRNEGRQSVPRGVRLDHDIGQAYLRLAMSVAPRSSGFAQSPGQTPGLCG